MKTQMIPEQQEAILTVCLMAAFADGGKSDAERAEIKRIVESLPDCEPRAAVIHQRVLQQQMSLAEAVAPLDSPALRHFAYEMAVCVCEADKVIDEREDRFLQSLRRELQLDTSATAAFQQQAGSTARTALAEPPGPAVDEAALDRSILNYSIVNGALELLPQSLSTMAIIPLQMKMVHAISKRYGYSLDRGHIREFLATLGVGLTSQVVEGFALKLLGGLFGRLGGHGGRGVTHAITDQVASSAIAFATTYGLGQAARRYYAGGRKMSAVDLKGLFGSLTENAKSLHTRYLPQIQERAGTLNMRSLLPMIRGQSPEQP
jgi:uncharacterized protein (DUF697 family)/tellurite resistance protein